MLFRSPIPYTGSKFKLLPQLISLFPKEIDTFYDAFTGGFNIGLNADAKSITATDINPQLIQIYQLLQQTPNIIDLVNQVVKTYNLSKTNAEGYYQLRSDYNKSPNPLFLLILLFHSFNFQMRFNPKGEFNMPFGKNRSYFNESIRKNLASFIEIIQNKNITFQNKDYSQLNPNQNDFFYADPPYSLGEATYNSSWKTQDDLKLFDFLDNLDNKNIKFGLSNVLVHRGKPNNSLITWKDKYICHQIQCHYRKNSYHKKDRSSETIEVYVTNKAIDMDSGFPQGQLAAY